MIENVKLNEIKKQELTIPYQRSGKDLKNFMMDMAESTPDAHNTVWFLRTSSYTLFTFPRNTNFAGARCGKDIGKILETIKECTNPSRAYDMCVTKGLVIKELQGLNDDGWWDDVNNRIATVTNRNLTNLNFTVNLNYKRMSTVLDIGE